MNTQSTALRFDRVSRLFHWISAAFILGQLTFGWLLDEFERGSPAKAAAMNLHKSVGLVIALIVVARLWWRAKHPAPQYPATVAPKQVAAARWGHRLLYVAMVALPLTGYIGANFSKHGIHFFDLVFLPPWGPDNKDIHEFFNDTHSAIAFAFSALIAGHIALGIYHRVIAKDGLFERMTSR
jgi:cytochrome b561